MIVQIEPNIYNQTQYFDVLDQFVHIFQSGKHHWDIRYPEELLNSTWMKIEEVGKRQRKRVDDLIKTSVHGLYTSKKQRKRKINLIITEGLESDLAYHPYNALLMMNDAAYIVVENLNSDRTFIEVIANAFNNKEIIKALEHQWLKFDAEGGTGGIKRRIDFHFQKPFKPRLLVFIDSDKEFPDDEYNDKVKEITRVTQERHIKYHVLQKRAIENYIPIEAFTSKASNVNEVIQAYRNLEIPQKDFFDLKKGFKGKGQLPLAQRKLFNHMDGKNPTFKALRKGFNVRDFNQNNLYLFFRSDKVTKKTLQKRCGITSNELETIISKISSLL